MAAAPRAYHRRALLFATVLLVSAPHPSSGCFLDLLGICGGVSKITQELDELPDKVRDAAEQVLDQLFNKDLPQAVDKLTAAAEQLVDRGEKDYEKAINATRQQFEALAKAVVHDCEELAKDLTKDVEEIVDTVMKNVLETVQVIIADVDNRVNELLSRLELIGQEIFCAATGFLDVFEHSISAYFQKQDCECVQQMLKDNPGLAQDCECRSCFHVGEFYPRCPCKPWGLAFGPGWYNRGKYQFAKCHLEKPIDYERWTVEQIISQLSIIQEMSLSFRCLEDMQPGSTVNRQYFGDEYTNVSHAILVYQNARGTEGSAARIPSSPPAARPKALASSKLVSLGGGGCEGMTVPQCITQALAELETATRDAKAQGEEFMEAKRQLGDEVMACNATLELLRAEVDTHFSAVSATFSTVFANSETNKNAISDNTQKISDLQSRDVGLCDCQSWDLRDDVPSGYVMKDITGYCTPDACQDDYYGIGGTPDIYICRPCMDGDSSFNALPKAKKKSCREQVNAGDIFT